MGSRVTHFSGNLALGSGSTEIPTAAKTLVADDNGKIFFLNAAGGFALTLPAVATHVGWRAKFVVGAAFATTDFTIVSAEGDNMEGSMIVAGVVVDVNAADLVTFVSTAENVGDFVEVLSDGTSWHVFGNALTTGALTATG